MTGVNGSGSSAATARLWQLAIFTAAGAIGTTSQAEAALYYWPDYSGGAHYYARPQSPEMQRPKRKRNAVKEVPEKETGAKPQGPLVIAVSIERQKVTIYDSNGVFAESPVSTGMKGHATPMGVFSIIQKHKFHHSNIYSGAPMPYMQRITWSGVAMHAGVLPGYPASHGCIRMPMAFATKMWNWTKMGARVIVAPGEMSPMSFSHPLLATMRVPPQPAASAEPLSNVADKADKGAEIKSASAEAVLELRSTVGHVMSDATTGNALARADAPADKTDVPKAETIKTADASEAAKPQVDDAAAKTEAKTDDAAAKPADSASTEAKPADAAVTAQAEPAKPEPAKDETAKSEPAKTEPAKTEAVEVKKPDAPATAAAPVQPAATDAKKDQTRAADPAPAAKPEPPKRAGQIAVFISRKDSKLYVRQNFAPLFDVPVTIAASDRPLGTHVFTAEVDKTDTNALRWSVVSLPVSVRSVEREDESRTTRRQRMGAAVIPVAAKPVIVPNSPAEALDRIQIPADTMAKINEMLTTGGSIVVSDQGINQGETGEGTDFIVRLR